MEAVREALAMAQQAGDAACLAHVVGWAARAARRGRRAALLAHMPSRTLTTAPAAANTTPTTPVTNAPATNTPTAAAAATAGSTPSAPHAAHAAAAQFLAQHVAVNGTRPADVFAVSIIRLRLGPRYRSLSRLIFMNFHFFTIAI